MPLSSDFIKYKQSLSEKKVLMKNISEIRKEITAKMVDFRKCDCCKKFVVPLDFFNGEIEVKDYADLLCLENYFKSGQ